MVRQRSGARLYRDVIRTSSWRPAPVTVLLGSESFFKRDLAARIVEQVAGATRQLDSFTEVIPATPDDILAAILDLRTPSFLSARRVVCVRDGDKHLAAIDDALVAALTQGLPCGCLVIDAEKLPSKAAFTAAASERDAVVDCRRLWDSPPPWKGDASPFDTELHQWVVEHAARLGLRLSTPLAGELVGLTGNVPGTIDQELRKLKDRLGGATAPTAEHFAALVPDTRQDSIFHVVDRALAGELTEAHAGVLRLVRLGYSFQGKVTVDPAAIAQLAIGALASRLRILRRATRLVGEGQSSDSLVAAGIIPRTAVPAVTAQLRRWDEDAIDEGFRVLLGTDRALKGKFGRLDPGHLIETAVIRLARMASRPRGGRFGGVPVPWARR